MMFVDGIYCPMCEAERELAEFESMVGEKAVSNNRGSKDKPKMLNKDERKQLEQELMTFVWKQNKEQSPVQDSSRKSDEDLMNEFLAEED